MTTENPQPNIKTVRQTSRKANQPRFFKPRIASTMKQGKAEKKVIVVTYDDGKLGDARNKTTNIFLVKESPYQQSIPSVL